MLKISFIYCCDTILTKFLSNEFSFGSYYPFFSDGNSNLIIICVECLSYFKSLFGASNFCFEELKKCLSERFLREDESRTLPTKFEQLT